MASAHVLIHQARVGMAGITGFDATACLALLEARGIPQEIAGLLLPYWEAGLVEAAEEQREDSSQ